MFRVALIGSGYIAQNHIRALNALPGVTLAAIVNPDIHLAEEAAREAGCAACASLDEATALGGIDVADICSPTFTHEAYTVAAAQAGCHVLCEKPVTFTLESLDRMTGACEKAGVRFMVAQVARWWPEFRTIKEYIAGGKLGDIHLIYEKRLARHPNWAAWHRDPQKSGGGLYDINIHDIDFLYSCFGLPERVYAVGWRSPTGCWNHVSTSLTWPSGLSAVCETSMEMTGRYPFSIEFRGVGDNGTLQYQLSAGLNINDGPGESRFVWYPGSGAPQALSAPTGDMFEGEIGEFLSAIRENRPAAVTPDQTRDVLRIVLASRRSMEEGVAVTL